MKKIIVIVLAVFIFSACSDKKAQTKKVFDEVMQIHEKVMGADEQLMNNKMKLDTLLKQSNPAGKDSVLLLTKQLAAADDAMNNWMHKFDPDYKGKSDNETLNYLNDQKKQIVAIDSSINNAVTASGRYLQKTIKK